LRRLLAAGTVAALVLLAACSDDKDDTSADTSASAATTATTAAGTSAPAATSTTAGAGTAASAPATTAPPTTAAPTTTAPDNPDLGAVKVKLTPVAQATEPVFVATRPGDAATLYIAERGGRLRALRNGALVEAPVLDISSLTLAGGERGFLGFAFAPDGSHLYVDYTDRDGNSHIDEYAVAADGTVDPATRRQVLFQQQPYPNHNGGEVIFGPDGYLYIGFGDGGSAGDPQRHGLDLGTWLGKILRIDPRASGDQPYSVPADNPFVNQAGAEPEIWSYGLRNPWRFSFDRATKDLWIGDVGQGNIEEVDRATVADGQGKGTNWGWSAFEGRARYNADQSPDGTVGPVFQYTHENGNCSVTGGYIYRGAAIPALRGAYLYTDYCGRGVRAIVVDAAGNAGDAVQLTDQPGSIVSFGEDANGEIYVCSLSGNTVYRIDPV
jgi:glucose/arabinose dehydrogenase